MSGPRARVAETQSPSAPVTVGFWGGYCPTSFCACKRCKAPARAIRAFCEPEVFMSSGPAMSQREVIWFCTCQACHTESCTSCACHATSCTACTCQATSCTICACQTVFTQAAANHLPSHSRIFAHAAADHLPSCLRMLCLHRHRGMEPAIVFCFGLLCPGF